MDPDVDRIVHWQVLTPTCATFGLARSEVLVVGSAVLAAYGIRNNGDLDIVINDAAYRRIADPTDSRLRINRHGSIWFSDECQAVHNRYANLGLDDESLFSDRYSFVVSGHRMLRAEVEFAHKVVRGRPKDRADLPGFERFALQQPTWDWQLVYTLMAAARGNPSTEADQPHPTVPKSRQDLRKVARAVRSPRRTLRGLAKLGRRRVRHLRHPKPVPARLHKSVGFADAAVRVQFERFLTVGALLDLQRTSAQFDRFDVLLRWHVIDAMNGADARDAIGWYSRMQQLRVGSARLAPFEELIDNVKTEGLDPRYPVVISEEGRLLDGSHRLASALAIDADRIAVRVAPSRKSPAYGRDWFEQRGFPESLLNDLDVRRELALIEHGVYTAVVIWPPAMPHADSIEQLVGAAWRRIESCDLDVGANLDAFLRSIYAIDDIDRWKIEVKLAAMRPFPDKVRFLLVDTDDHRFRVKARTGSYLSRSGAALKASIRNAFADQVDGYVYDIIVHTGDNHDHNRQTVRAIRSHTAWQPSVELRNRSRR